MNIKKLILEIFHILSLILIVLLAARFVFKLFGASTSSALVSWIYRSSAFFVQPFDSIFPNLNLDRFVIEFSSIIAMLCYLVASVLIYRVIRIALHIRKK